MTEGVAVGQNFLRAAEQGRIEHNVTASVAAAAMNAVKPARSHDVGSTVGGGYAGYANSYDGGELGSARQIRMPPSEKAGELPMKVPLNGRPPAKEEFAQSGLTGSAATETSSYAQEDWQSNWNDMQAQQMQQAMFAQMQQLPPYAAMGMNPYAAMGMGGGYPWGWPPMGPMDSSLMAQMGKSAYPMPMYGMNQMSNGSAGRGKKIGNDKKGKGGGGNEQKKKPKAKAGRDNSPDQAADSEEAAANRSPILNEVRKNHQRFKCTWEEVMPHLHEFSKDQHGSRFLQAKLDESSDEEKAAVFQAILPEVGSLAGDSFGNFVVQKLLDVCSSEQRKLLAERLEGKVCMLANETHGCRVIQKALQVLPRESQQRLAKELEHNVGTCIENMHGNHVIQKCVEQMPPDAVTFIIDEVNTKVEFWASHMYGCRVIQRLLEHCTSIQLPRMLDQLIVHVKKLSRDSYGNYVVQHMLEHGRQEDKAAIIQVISRDVVEYSKNKCSSNVVEKCFEIAAIGEHAAQLEQERRSLYHAVLAGNVADPHSPLMSMMDDRFGNYIVQRMIEHSKGEERQLLQKKLLSAEHILKNSNNGKHILSALHKEFGGV
mmetsp:Transcript_39465/g.62624  ORF Transcript_39465/g.62624 Transcript_39465/m.62624 type:complete len:599 (-) Transcript_39465:454-2250(-)